MHPFKKVELTPSVSIIIAGIIIAAAIYFTNTHAPAAVQAVDDGQAAKPVLLDNKPAAAAAVAAKPRGTTLVAPPAGTASIRPPSATEHIVGSPTAPIVLIEYSDFQCPFCNMVYPTIKKIVSESNGQVAWVYRHLPLISLHPEALPAANASECITEQLGNDGFWKFTDAMLAEQSKLSSGYYGQLAAQLGADPAKFAQCMSSHKYESKIEADATEAETNGGNGTPFTVVLNTKTNKVAPVSGALPYAQFMAAIQAVR